MVEHHGKVQRGTILAPAISRREVFAAGGTCLMTALDAPLVNATPVAALPPEPTSNPNVTPLAQEFVVVTRTPSVQSHYIHDPGLARLPNGHLFVATPARTHDLQNHKNLTYTSHSTDGGRNWSQLGSLPFCDATPITHEGKLYLFGQYEQGSDWYIRRSDDEGQTWSKPVLLFRGNYWNCSTSMVVHEGRLYWALGAGKPIFFHTVGICCDLGRGMLEPDAWRMSNIVSPPLPVHCTQGAIDPQGASWPGDWFRGLLCLEPNVVLINGRLRVLARAVIKGYTTANLGIVFDMTDRDGRLQLEFAQYYPIPGGQGKFFILYDDTTQLFFMLSNLVADAQDAFRNRERLAALGFNNGPGNERRLLFLHYSLDALNWFPAGCVARWPGMKQSFMYPSAAIDEEDLVLISRTSEHGRDQHDADLCTFHRIRNFRNLAMDLRGRYA